MKYALVNGERKEAEKGLSGFCEGCRQQVLPVCGIKRVKHWRHKVDCECDHWWENETEWHRGWKNNFPVECQEVVHKDEVSGEWHRADVKTKQDYILEFQHSFLDPVERLSRNKFYGDKLIWIVNGLRREADWSKLEPMLKTAKQVFQNINLFRLANGVDESPMLKEWSDCTAPVFFDFGVDKPLCCLLPKSSKGTFYVLPFQRQDFVALHNGALTKEGYTYSQLIEAFQKLVLRYENPEMVAAQQRQQVTVRSVLQRRLMFPQGFTQRDLNFLLRPPQPQRRRGRF